jgi:hypothetical protein
MTSIRQKIRESQDFWDSSGIRPSSGKFVRRSRSSLISARILNEFYEEFLKFANFMAKISGIRISEWANPGTLTHTSRISLIEWQCIFSSLITPTAAKPRHFLKQISRAKRSGLLLSTHDISSMTG